MRDESKLQHKEQPRDSETAAGAFCGESLDRVALRLERIHAPPLSQQMPFYGPRSI
jgi:hypothetical protein